MRFLLTVIMNMFCCALWAQQNSVQGIVIDKDTRYRMNMVKITNLETGKVIYNNSKGEFTIEAKSGDHLLAQASGYYADTLQLKDQQILLFYLQRKAILLQEVTVKDSVLSAQKKYEATRAEFREIYRLGNNKDLLQVGPTGAGLSIDALWSAFSKEGRNARKLEEIIDRDYQNDVIDQRFRPELVRKLTGLEGDDLLLFMIRYRPSFIFALRSNDYEMDNYIRIAFYRYTHQAEFQDPVKNLNPVN